MLSCRSLVCTNVIKVLSPNNFEIIFKAFDTIISTMNRLLSSKCKLEPGVRWSRITSCRLILQVANKLYLKNSSTLFVCGSGETILWYIWRWPLKAGAKRTSLIIIARMKLLEMYNGLFGGAWKKLQRLWWKFQWGNLDFSIRKTHSRNVPF